ncbi:MAG TPA: GNAT family N-acetyltransferase [Chitinophagaceae bacterium]|nr:GNAT family N-acetyltransferase [Chitinophagaceae bacterium]
MSANPRIRLITMDDASATLDIYRPYVENTIISFEYEAPDLQEWQTRIKTITAEYPWLVYEANNQVIGYAYGCKHRYRTAYSWATECSIYLSENFHGKGIARILYETLFDLMRLQGYVNVYAGITVPNPKSEHFHQSVGFYDVGYYRNIGYKFGAWHDTRWMQLHLADKPANPPMPKPMKEVQDTEAFKAILDKANSRL